VLVAVALNFTGEPSAPPLTAACELCAPTALPRCQTLVEMPSGPVVSTLGVMSAPAPVALQLITAPAVGVLPRRTTMRMGVARSCPAEPDWALPLGSERAAESAAGSGPPPP
jgi:hypothetical protein